MVASAPGAVWRDIETAPKDGTEVLLLWFDSGTGATPMRRVGFWHSREQAWCDTHRVLHNQHSHPTHWTSLPSPTPADEPITAWTPDRDAAARRWRGRGGIVWGDFLTYPLAATGTSDFLSEAGRTSGRGARPVPSRPPASPQC